MIIDDINHSVSTRQASELLEVHESSIKRWCNSGNLDCWLTQGNHRRIPVSVLVEFAAEKGMALSLMTFGERCGTVWAGTRSFMAGESEELDGLIFDWLQAGQRSLVAALFRYLIDEGVSVGSVLDHLIAPAMRRVGYMYVHDELSIGDEHLMTQTMRDALVLFSSSTADDESRKATSGGLSQPVAIVGCGRGEVHELGALMARITLELSGWSVVYLGLNVPTEEFATKQNELSAGLVCISIMPPMGMTEARAIVLLLDRMSDASQSYRLVVGGGALDPDGAMKPEADNLREIQFFRKMERFADWVADNSN